MEHSLRCLALCLLARTAAPFGEPRGPGHASEPHAAPGSLPPAGAVAALLGRRGLRLHAGAPLAGTTEPPLPDLPGHVDVDIPDEHDLDPDDVKKAILEGDASIVDGVKQRFRECIDDFRRLPSGMRHMFISNLHLIERLMPGMEARTSSTLTLPVIVVSGILWGTVYFMFFYTHDHEEHHHFGDDHSRPKTETATVAQILTPRAWRRQIEATTTSTSSVTWEDAAHAQKLDASQESTNKFHMHADVVFVFPHPSYELQHDRDKLVTREMLQGALAHRPDQGFFQGIETVIRDHDLKVSRATAAEKALRRIRSTVGEALDITMGELRILVLKDMCRSLPLFGFSVNLFSSIDGDELFLCISLNRPEVVSHYLQRGNVELQTTHAVVERLKILQDPRDPQSSPPFLRYDQRLVKSLFKANAIDEPDERALYRLYRDSGVEGSVMSGSARIRVIQLELTRFLNLEAVKDVGIVTDWYPCHSELWLNRLRDTWAPLEVVTDLSFVQPIPLVGEYYGSQLAFGFVWQGVWSKGLVCLSVAAILITVLKFVPVRLAVQLLGVDVGVRLGDRTVVPERQLMPFSILILAWARVMANLWRRDEEYFKTLWNEQDAIDQIIRPSFKGVFMKSDVDGNLMEENAPFKTAVGLRVLSVCITLVCCAAVMLISGTWVHIHRGDLDLVASLWLSIIVKISELLYNALSARLVEMENHKYDQDYHDSWVWGQFLFQAVNNYWPCVSVAFSQLVSGHCPEAGCFLALQRQVSMLVGILLACSIGLSVLEAVQVWLVLRWEDYKLQKSTSEDGSVKHRSFLEEQSKYTPFNMRAQIENMLQLVIGLGFVMLFGTLQPMVVPLCLVHFACALRFRALLLTWKFTRRPLPHKLGGVGAWSGVMTVLMNFGIFFSGVLVVLWGRFFHGALLLAKISGLVMWFMLISGIWALVDIVVPPTSPHAKVLVRRRNYASRVITEAAMDAQAAESSHRPSNQAGHALVGDEAADEGSCSSGSGLGGDCDDVEASSDESGPAPGKKASRMPSLGASLNLASSTTNRTVHLHLGCDVEDLIPLGRIVQNEDWLAIPRLDGQLTRTLRAGRESSEARAPTR